MSRYAIKRTSDKNGEKVSDLYFHIYIFVSILGLLEVCQFGHT